MYSQADGDAMMDPTQIIVTLIGAVTPITLAWIAYKTAQLTKSLAQVKEIGEKNHVLLNGPLGKILERYADKTGRIAAAPGASQQDQDEAVAAKLASDDHKQAAAEALIAKDASSLKAVTDKLTEAAGPVIEKK